MSSGTRKKQAEDQRIMEEQTLQHLTERPWEETLEFLTTDMDPANIDICVLTERYREYIKQLQKNNLQVSAKAIRVCAALLNMKTLALKTEEVEEEAESEEEIEEIEGEMIDDEFYEEGKNEEIDLDDGPTLEMPVKKKPKRRVHLDELKDSLRDAMEVKERREERQQQRQQMDDQFEFDEENLQDKLDSLYSEIKNYISAPADKINFTKLISNNHDNEDKIERFKHVLNLENDQKVDLIQNEFLGDLKIQTNKENMQAN